MLSSLVKLIKISARPIYDFFAKPLHRRVLAEVEAEIQQLHQHYLEFQAQYHRKVTDELLNLTNQIEELKRDRVTEHK